MFLRNCRNGYNRHGEQSASGLFLILFDNPNGGMSGLVRHVRLKQLGCWMMGSINIGGKRFTMSGSYGSDGLCDSWEKLPPGVIDELLPLPKELYDLWNKGGGHNSCGSEAPAMAVWAIENLERLRKPIKKRMVAA